MKSKVFSPVLRTAVGYCLYFIFSWSFAEGLTENFSSRKCALTLLPRTETLAEMFAQRVLKNNSFHVHFKTRGKFSFRFKSF